MVLVRDTGLDRAAEDGDPLELLMLQRTRRARSGRPGPWVFPGGRIEPEDGGPDFLARARVAAVRETREEAGLELDGQHLLPISRWITPDVSPERFDVWFFVARIGRGEEVRVDGVEMCGHRWSAPRGVLEAHHSGEMRLAPPTYVTVSWLVAHASAGAALAALGSQEILTFRPRICPGNDGTCMLYPGDAGYEASEPGRKGPRHRLWARREGWHYERDAGLGS